MQPQNYWHEKMHTLAFAFNVDFFEEPVAEANDVVEDDRESEGDAMPWFKPVVAGACTLNIWVGDGLAPDVLTPAVPDDSTTPLGCLAWVPSPTGRGSAEGEGANACAVFWRAVGTDGARLDFTSLTGPGRVLPSLVTSPGTPLAANPKTRRKTIQENQEKGVNNAECKQNKSHVLVLSSINASKFDLRLAYLNE